MLFIIILIEIFQMKSDIALKINKGDNMSFWKIEHNFYLYKH